MHIDRFLKNKTGLWDPQELLEAPYAQEKEINLTENHPKITLKEEKYGLDSQRAYSISFRIEKALCIKSGALWGGKDQFSNNCLYP